jgi:hypothetical protein
LLPAVGATDKGKTLQTNATTGAPEWAEASGGGGGVLMVTDTGGTLDKTMGEIQDAYLAGKRVIINTSDGSVARDVIGINPIFRGKSTYEGVVETYFIGNVNSQFAIFLLTYNVFGEETEEAARNAYPVFQA